MHRRPTIREVASKASLSISTISLFLNNSSKINKETRRKIQHVIEELGYTPRRSARGLASKLSGNIGFIVSEDHFTQVEPFYTRIFLGTEFEARDLEYYILLTTVGRRFANRRSIPRFLHEGNVDGVILAGRIHERYVDHIEKLGLPIVLVDYKFPRQRISAVQIDNRSGIRDALYHLTCAGHKRIAFLGGDLSHPSIADRLAAYREAMVDAGLETDESLIIIDNKSTSTADGYDAADQMLRRGAHPTAIIAANDAMAIGCMQLLKSKGIKVPADVAVVGFDDIEMSSHVDPRLTTVRVPKEEFGRVAVRRLVELIKSKSHAVTTTHVPVELVIRESSVWTGSRQSGTALNHKKMSSHG
jgi:LacI family transcriptional regulator